MYSLRLPYDLGDVLLTPPWGGLPPALQTGLIAAVCLVPLVLVLWLYRYEMQLVSRTMAAGLLFLRMTVLSLLLALVCLQPIYGRTRTDNLPGYVLVAVDRSESMEVADRQRSTDEKPQTRSQVAERILRGDGVGLLPALTGKHEVELLGFNQEAWELKPDQLAELFRRVDGEGKERAGFTNLRLPLVHALNRTTLGQGKVLGIVLLTDGQHNTGEPPTAKARELGERGLPIYPIALGNRHPPPDAVLVSIKAPNTVFKEVETRIEVTYKITGLPAQDFLVELNRVDGNDKKVLAERVVHHAGEDRTYTESFPVNLDDAGTQTLVATVRPVNPDTKETRADNNTRRATVNVADDKAKVLLIDGEARWEYHYLAAALKRDKTLKVESVLFEQPRLHDNLDPAEAEKQGLPRQQIPSGADALAEFDCIILGDVSPERLPAAERKRLEKFVSERGGTVVILAGKRYMPLAYPVAGAGGESDPLRKLLPIESPHAVAPTEGFGIALTPAGKETKFMEMDADPARSESIWGGLPRHFWSAVGSAKPGATTLATVAQNDLRESGKQAALIVTQNYGFGRVLYVGLDSTWRWRYRVGDLYHHTFWGAAIRWAASDKPLMTGNDFLRFGTSQPVYGHDEEVQVIVRLNEELGPIKPDLSAAARILKAGENGQAEKVVALLPLSGKEAQPRVLEGRVRRPAAGRIRRRAGHSRFRRQAVFQGDAAG